MFVCCECRVLSGSGLCDELITRPEESYRLCCVVVCDLETSRMSAPYIYDISRLRVKFKVKAVIPHFQTASLYCCPVHVQNSAIKTLSHRCSPSENNIATGESL